MYSTNQVATILEVDDRTVRNYILKGKLKAKLDGGNYVISIKDLCEFEDNFFYTDERFKKRGKRLDEESFKNLVDFVDAVKNMESLEEVIKKYQKANIEIPSLKVYTIYERNKQIKSDKKKGLTYKELSEKYFLCEKSISNVLKNKELN